MLDLMQSLMAWKYWDAILSILVIVHLISEYGHYIWEFVSGRKEAEVLDDILQHRKQSNKTERLIHIQDDLDEIKKHLNMEEKDG
ncbi:MAG: hypothetical protein GOV02_02985 [Candidatus Aenigmarchaeota archaeon]|nr:hypothetical protein [Candidatus Aenigmarchaeota archaeon]